MGFVGPKVYVGWMKFQPQLCCYRMVPGIPLVELPNLPLTAFYRKQALYLLFLCDGINVE